MGQRNGTWLRASYEILHGVPCTAPSVAPTIMHGCLAHPAHPAHPCSPHLTQLARDWTRRASKKHRFHGLASGCESGARKCLRQQARIPGLIGSRCALRMHPLADIILPHRMRAYRPLKMTTRGFWFSCPLVTLLARWMSSTRCGILAKYRYVGAILLATRALVMSVVDGPKLSEITDLP